MPASVLDRCDPHIGSNRTGIGHQRRRVCNDRPERAFVIEEFVEHALDRRFGVVGTAIAHVGVLVAGLYDRDARLLTDPFRRDDPGIGLELRILRTERQDLELSLIHISEPTRQAEISYAVFCLKKKKTWNMQE